MQAREHALSLFELAHNGKDTKPALDKIRASCTGCGSEKTGEIAMLVFWFADESFLLVSANALTGEIMISHGLRVEMPTDPKLLN